MDGAEEGPWSPALRELAARRERARRMGGEEGIARQRAQGKQTARERIALLLDPDSFREMGQLAGAGRYSAEGALEDVTPANSIVGTGAIDGRRVAVAADDFTIRGGSVEATIAEKWIYAERYAREMRLPLVRLVDSVGGSVRTLEQAGYAAVPGYPSWPVIPLLDCVPVVGVAMGACAGLGAVKVMAAHFSVMVRGTAQLFAAGPPVVKRALGLTIDREALGGADMHARGSGMVDNDAADEADALAQARRFLSYLPRHVGEPPPRLPRADDPARLAPLLRDIIPHDKRLPYDPRVILDAVCDHGSVFEIGRHHGGSSITALGRLDGVPVAIMANDPHVAAGAMTRLAAQKVERMVELAEQFHLPVVNLVDQPGNMVGPQAEREGTLLAAVRLLKAIERSRTPWISIILRRVYGVAGGLHGRKHGVDGRSINHRYAWPSGAWGSLPVEGGVAAAYRREIEASSDPAAAREAIEARYQGLQSPFRTAEHFGVVDIIDPAETRAVLCDWVQDAWELVRIHADQARARL